MKLASTVTAADVVSVMDGGLAAAAAAAAAAAVVVVVAAAVGVDGVETAKGVEKGYSWGDLNGGGSWATGGRVVVAAVVRAVEVADPTFGCAGTDSQHKVIAWRHADQG